MNDCVSIAKVMKNFLMNWFNGMDWRENKRKSILPHFKGEGKFLKSVQEGRYKLDIYRYGTKQGCWEYTQGRVYRDGNFVTNVNRNYSSFPFSWIVGHANGHDYLVAGEDYQGQTIIELDTGKRSDTLPEDAEKGWGFCWAIHKYFPKQQILVVDGCLWACPYEFRFYDFSDPLNFKEIKYEDDCILSDGKFPTFESDGIIRCYQLDIQLNDGEDCEDDEEIEKAIVAHKDFKRIGNKLEFQNEWVSEEEQVRRKRSQEAWDRREREIKEFKEKDSLYLSYLENLKDGTLSPENSEGCGVTYNGWCPNFDVEERRWCRRIIKNTKGYTVDLDWGIKTGPVKLTIFKNGNHLEDKFWMEHSVQSINDAFEYAKELIK